MKCAECDKPIDSAIDEIYNEDFAVCRPCHDETKVKWEIDKAALRAEGHKIPCDSIVKLSKELSSTAPENT